MYGFAKGIRKYVGIVASILSIASSGTVYGAVQQSNLESRSEDASLQCYSPCDDTMKKDIDFLEIKISLSDYSLTLEGVAGDRRCTLLEERVIVGKRGWSTPVLDSTIEYAKTNPYWYPPKSILEELKSTYPEDYMKNTFYHSDGVYMRPGNDNPLGKVAFRIKDGGGVLIHGTPNKSSFNAKDRRYSHGCIRIEDEVKLLDALSEVAGTDDGCDADCALEAIDSGVSRRISFKKPVKLKVTR